jgi:hypothetical protein
MLYYSNIYNNLPKPDIIITSEALEEHCINGKKH